MFVRNQDKLLNKSKSYFEAKNRSRSFEKCIGATFEALKPKIIQF